MPPRRVLALGAALLVFAATPTVALAAGPYPPPSSGSASVNPSRIKAGQCTSFSGDGLAAGVPVAVRDDASAAGSTTADKRGAFRLRLCFGTDARTGQHVISGSGQSPEGTPLTVSAVLTITGVEQTGSGPNAGNAAAASGPGADVVVAEPAAVGSAELASAPRTAAGGVTSKEDTSAGRLRSLDGLGAAAAMVALLLSLVAAAWLLLLLGRRRQRDQSASA